eukprot:660011-Pleurochrysis_carterae.AAC.1
MPAASSDDSEWRGAPEHGGCFYAYEKAGGFLHDQSVYSEWNFSTPKRKADRSPSAGHPKSDKDPLVSFVNYTQLVRDALRIMLHKNPL